MEPGVNPFVALRRTIGLGQADFARALGVSLPSLWAAENGTTAHPMGVFRALRAVGYEPAELVRAYDRWRARAVEGERNRMRNIIASIPKDPAPRSSQPH
jgi:transcriptional regulator with XRE-family HTH domain